MPARFLRLLASLWDGGGGGSGFHIISLIAMDLASPPRRVSPARADMVDDVGAAAVSAVSPKLPAAATTAAEVEPADANAASAEPTCTSIGGHKINEQNRISVAHLRGKCGADFEGKAA